MTIGIGSKERIQAFIPSYVQPHSSMAREELVPVASPLVRKAARVPEQHGRLRSQRLISPVAAVDGPEVNRAAIVHIAGWQDQLLELLLDSSPLWTAMKRQPSRSMSAVARRPDKRSERQMSAPAQASQR